MPEDFKIAVETLIPDSKIPVINGRKKSKKSIHQNIQTVYYCYKQGTDLRLYRRYALHDLILGNQFFQSPKAQNCIWHASDSTVYPAAYVVTTVPLHQGQMDHPLSSAFEKKIINSLKPCKWNCRGLSVSFAITSCPDCAFRWCYCLLFDMSIYWGHANTCTCKKSCNFECSQPPVSLIDYCT